VPETQSAGDILTIRQLAEYLMISEKTVYRMLDRIQLPAVWIGAQWRFRRQDIDGWLTEEARRVEYGGQRGVLDTFETAEIAIQPLVARENVWLALKPRSRDELLSFMIHEATLGPDVDRRQLLRSVLDREALCSTAQEPIHYSDPHGHRPRVIAMILARSRAIKPFGDAKLAGRLASAQDAAAAIALIGDAESRLAPKETGA
jgi:excisionase family DNA binding protein